VPSARRNAFADLSFEFIWWQRPTCLVPVLIAEQAGGDDIRCIIAATVAPWFEMLGGCLKQARPRFRYRMCLGESCRIFSPHGRLAIVTTSFLLAEAGIANFLNIRHTLPTLNGFNAVRSDLCRLG
jgi:hypothetical protein